MSKVEATLHDPVKDTLGSRDDAIRELVRFRYNRIWFRIPHLLREIDVDRLKARIASP